MNGAPVDPFGDPIGLRTSRRSLCAIVGSRRDDDQPNGRHGGLAGRRPHSGGLHGSARRGVRLCRVHVRRGDAHWQRWRRRLGRSTFRSRTSCGPCCWPGPGDRLCRHARSGLFSTAARLAHAPGRDGQSCARQPALWLAAPLGSVAHRGIVRARSVHELGLLCLAVLFPRAGRARRPVDHRHPRRNDLGRGHGGQCGGRMARALLQPAHHAPRLGCSDTRGRRPRCRPRKPVWAAVLLYLLATAAMGVYQPVKQAYLHQLTPSSQRATVVSFDSPISNGTSTAGQTALGYLARWSPSPRVTWSAAR